MIPPRRQPTQETNVDSWLMSYSDMITLLLCFFIIFVSLSEPREDRLAAVTEGMAGTFGSVEMSTPFQGVFRALQTVIESNQLLKDVSVQKTDRGVTMEISTVAFYAPNSAEFDPDMTPMIAALAEQLHAVDYLSYSVTIEGHTNDLPVSTPYYPSNWELSAARATRMARFLIENGIRKDRIEASGFADTRPKVPNLDLNGNVIIENRKQNERVVIKLEQMF